MRYFLCVATITFISILFLAIPFSLVFLSDIFFNYTITIKFTQPKTCLPIKFSVYLAFCLHQNGIVHWYDIHTAPFKQSFIFEVGFFWTVPIFFMLNGATLFDYRSRYSTKEFLLQRAKRVLIPFLFSVF